MLSLLVGFALAVPARSMAILPAKPSTGTLAAVNKGEATLSLIDLANGKSLAKLPTGPNPQEVVFTSDAKWAVVTNMGQGQAAPGKTLTVVDVAARKVSKEIELGEHGSPHGIVMLDRTRALLTSHATDHLVIVNLSEGKIERAMPSGGKGTHLVVLSPDKKLAYAANVYSATLTVVEVATGKLVKSIACGTRAEGISISPDGRTLAIGNVGDNTVTVIDAQKLEVRETLTNTQLPIRTFFTSDGKSLLVSCANSGEIAVFDSATLKEQKRIDLKKLGDLKLTGGPHPMPMNFDRHPTGAMIYVVILNADAVIAIDDRSLEVVARFATGKLPDGIAVTQSTSKTNSGKITARAKER